MTDKIVEQLAKEQASDIESHGTGNKVPRLTMDDGIIDKQVTSYDGDNHAFVTVSDDGLVVEAIMRNAGATFPTLVHGSLAAALLACNEWLTRQQATSIDVGDERHLKLTSAQETSVHRKWCDNPNDMSYRNFRLSVTPELCGRGAVMVKWCSMWLGIETDGITHS